MTGGPEPSEDDAYPQPADIDAAAAETEAAIAEIDDLGRPVRWVLLHLAAAENWPETPLLKTLAPHGNV